MLGGDTSQQVAHKGFNPTPRNLRPGLHKGQGLIAHWPKIECFGPTIELNKVINWAQGRKLGLHPKSFPFLLSWA